MKTDLVQRDGNATPGLSPVGSQVTCTTIVTPPGLTKALLTFPLLIGKYFRFSRFFQQWQYFVLCSKVAGNSATPGKSKENRDPHKTTSKEKVDKRKDR